MVLSFWLLFLYVCAACADSWYKALDATLDDGQPANAGDGEKTARDTRPDPVARMIEAWGEPARAPPPGSFEALFGSDKRPQTAPTGRFDALLDQYDRGPRIGLDSTVELTNPFSVNQHTGQLTPQGARPYHNAPDQALIAPIRLGDPIKRPPTNEATYQNSPSWPRGPAYQPSLSYQNTPPYQNGRPYPYSPPYDAEPQYQPPFGATPQYPPPFEATPQFPAPPSFPAPGFYQGQDMAQGRDYAQAFYGPQPMYASQDRATPAYNTNMYPVESGVSGGYGGNQFDPMGTIRAGSVSGSRSSGGIESAPEVEENADEEAQSSGEDTGGVSRQDSATLQDGPSHGLLSFVTAPWEALNMPSIRDISSTLPTPFSSSGGLPHTLTSVFTFSTYSDEDDDEHTSTGPLGTLVRAVDQVPKQIVRSFLGRPPSSEDDSGTNNPFMSR